MNPTKKSTGVWIILFLLIFFLIPVSRVEATSITIGVTDIFPIGDNGNGNLLVSQSATLSQTATIQSLSFYVTAAAGDLRLGIYDATGPSGGPGALKAETNSFTPTTGWNTANVITPVSLTAGTYWLAYLPSSSSLQFLRSNTIPSKYYSYAFGSMPTTFSTSPSSGTYGWSFYATLDTPPTRIMRLFEGFRIKLLNGRIILKQKQ